LLWTPGYWGWRDRVYVWNAGYWGPHVGYYGGINYGFGYVGVGYAGGYWNGGVLTYNRTVNNFGGVTIVNTYSKTVVNETTVNQVSFNGPGGASAQPTSQELAAAREQHTPPTALQTQHAQSASTNRSLLAAVNHGNPGIAATPKPGTFSGPGVVGSKMSVGSPGNNPLATGSTKGSNTPGGNSPAGPTPNGPTNGPANNRSLNTVTNQTNNGRGSDNPINGTAKGTGTSVSTLTPSSRSSFNPPPARGAGPPPGGPRKPPPPKKPQKP
jgi:hypothetical protein